MAYTTSALSYMLRGLDKAIIFTGSQIPLGLRRNDARENLITSLILASEHHVPEVSLFFGHQLFRGNRVTKVSTDVFNAFQSPNFPSLGQAGTNIEINQASLWTHNNHQLQHYSIEPQRVATFRLFPGVPHDVLDNLLKHPIQALVLESFGVGNGPTSPKFTEVIRKAVDRGVIVVNCSQCIDGCVDMTDYATGKSLADAGVVSGHDMTIEAAVTKLIFLLSHESDPAEVRERFGKSLAGEVSSPPESDESNHDAR